MKTSGGYKGMEPSGNLIHDLVGESKALKETIRFVYVVARSSVNVLVQGESGTGKEVTVRAIHGNSGRSGPLITVNCAAIPKDLLESELFGHEKGSFTGAFAHKRGKFEVADGGTLFLDEIGDMRLDLQPKLLTAIENGCIQRLGGLTDIHVDARVIAATNKDLRAEVERGAFRQDLYYRLCTTSIVLPPLRERTEDIPLLIRNFIKSMAAVAVRGVPGKTVVTGISPEAESILCNHRWPGNIRELKNVIAHALLFTSGDTIQPEDLAIAPSGPQPIAVSAPAAVEVLPEFETMDEVVRRTKREYVLSAHKRVKGNPTALAKMIPIHRKGLPRFLDSLGLSHLKQPRRGAKPTLPNS